MAARAGLLFATVAGLFARVIFFNASSLASVSFLAAIYLGSMLLPLYGLLSLLGISVEPGRVY